MGAPVAFTHPRVAFAVAVTIGQECPAGKAGMDVLVQCRFCSRRPDSGARQRRSGVESNGGWSPSKPQRLSHGPTNPRVHCQLPHHRRLQIAFANAHGGGARPLFLVPTPASLFLLQLAGQPQSQCAGLGIWGAWVGNTAMPWQSRMCRVARLYSVSYSVLRTEYSAEKIA